MNKLNQNEHKPPHHFFIKPLPLQNETVWFILINCLDIFMTYMLLRFGGLESNPIANFFLHHWNIQGLVFFKMAIVAFVLVLAQLVAWRQERKGRLMLWAGSAIVGAVVIYSVMLFVTRILVVPPAA